MKKVVRPLAGVLASASPAFAEAGVKEWVKFWSVPIGILAFLGFLAWVSAEGKCKK